MHWVHLTARAVTPRQPFDDPHHAAWFWDHAREAFPRSLASMLMPNHPHLLVLAADPEAARTTLRRLVGGLAQRMGISRGLFEPVPAPQIVIGWDKVRRVVRYILLNPCRARLCDDPLRWIWSTARDVVGAVADPWVRLEDLRAAFGDGRELTVERVHAFVSGDPSVAVQGTPAPRPVVASSVPVRPLSDIVQAAAVATRAPTAAVLEQGATRQLFLALARDQGWRGSADLGEVCGMSARSVTRLVASCDPAFVCAGRMCLGDERLLHPRPGDAAGLARAGDLHALPRVSVRLGAAAS